MKNTQRKETKKSLQHRVFVFGHPVKYETHLTGLTVVDRTRRNAVVRYNDSKLNTTLSFRRSLER